MRKMHHTKRNFWLTILFSVCVVVIALPAPTWMPGWWKKVDDTLAINLGLDLQGGLHLEYKLDLSKVRSMIRVMIQQKPNSKL